MYPVAELKWTVMASAEFASVFFAYQMVVATPLISVKQHST